MPAYLDGGNGPAWAPIDHLLRAMVRPCNDGKLRGYLVVRRVAAPHPNPSPQGGEGL